jgi:uncharacterized membrane-anchored protein
MKKITLIFSLALPILSLLILTAQKAYTIHLGLEYHLKIKGFDPIDLLSGHYVTYRVEYGSEPCDEYIQAKCICLNKNNTIHPLENCEKNSYCTSLLKGECKKGRFEAGIERFYIPEDRADEYDRIVREGNSEIIISVDKYGNGQVKDLILSQSPKVEIEENSKVE